jgi:carboxylate-amine ligase
VIRVAGGYPVGVSGLTLGVEEEFLLVDGEGRLSAGGQEVADGVREGVGQTEHELMRCQVELATGVCAGADQVVGELVTLRAGLAGEAARRGLRLLPSGTSPLGGEERLGITPDSRYERMGREFGRLARATLTCACHVHVGVPERAAGLTVSNGVRRWLPVLLALTGNSPYHNGTDTGYASWRHVHWTRWPSSGAPPHFDSLDHYESLVDGLFSAGAILDRGMVYWDVRLSEHAPTVEIRIADVAATVREAALLAVLVRGLARRALDDPPGADGPPREVLRAQLWRAARDGTAGRCVDPLSGELVPSWQAVGELVDHVRPELVAEGDEDFVADTLRLLRATGSGADRQRAAYRRRHRLSDVVDALAEPVRDGVSRGTGSGSGRGSGRTG